MNAWLFSILLLICLGLAMPQGDENDIQEETDDEQKCPPWGKWQTSKCLWPNQPLTSLPKSCIALPKKPQIPNILKQFIQSKQQEVYSLVQNLFKLRGANNACGYCSRKIRCRQRQNGEWKKGCKFEQVQLVNEECEGSQACVISNILGACPPPIPNPRPRRRPGPRDLVDGMDEIPDYLAVNNLEMELGKNASQGPPLWHCARNKDGSKCLCCCGWYFPDSKSGKCVKIKKESDLESEEDLSWTWNGLEDFREQYPLDSNDGIGEGSVDQQIPPPEIEPIPVNPDTDRVNFAPLDGARLEKKKMPDNNEI